MTSTAAALLVALALGQADESPIDTAIRAHWNSNARTTSQIAVGVIDRAELLWDAADEIPLVGLAGRVSLLPVEIVVGQRIVDMTRASIEKDNARQLERLLYTVVPNDYRATLRPGMQISPKTIERDLRISEALTRQLNRADVTEEERRVLQSTWQRAVTQNTAITMQSLADLTATTADSRAALSALAKRQLRSEKQVSSLAADVQKAVQAVTSLESTLRAQAQAEQRLQADARRRLSTEGNFEQRLSLAQKCRQRAQPGCPTDAEQSALIARGKVRDAALKAGEAIDVYLNGSLQIATNLGAEIPDWVGKAVVGASSAASIVVGATSGQPQLVVSGLIGLSSLCKRRSTSPEAAQLQAINERLFRMSQQLEVIDRLLRVLVLEVRELRSALETISNDVGKLTEISNEILGRLVEQQRVQWASCQLLYPTDEEAFPWFQFYRYLNRRGDDREDRRQCRNMVRLLLATSNSPTSYFRAPQPPRYALRDLVVALATPLLDGGVVEHDNPVGRLEFALLPPARTEREVLLRVLKRNQVQGPTLPASLLVTELGSQLSHESVSLAASRVALFLRTEPGEPALVDAAKSARNLLRLALLQTTLWDDESLVDVTVAAALVAERGPTQHTPFTRNTLSRHTDGGARDAGLPDGFKLPTVEKKFMADFLLAQGWVQHRSYDDFRRNELALEIAWRSASVQAVQIRAEAFTGKQDFSVRGDGQDAAQVCPGATMAQSLSLTPTACLTLAEFQELMNSVPVEARLASGLRAQVNALSTDGAEDEAH